MDNYKNNSTESAEAARTAAETIKKFCVKRINNGGACRECPIKDICYKEPYLWEV